MQTIRRYLTVITLMVAAMILSIGSAAAETYNDASDSESSDNVTIALMYDATGAGKYEVYKYVSVNARTVTGKDNTVKAFHANGFQMEDGILGFGDVRGDFKAKNLILYNMPNNHHITGWYYDAGRTEPVRNISYSIMRTSQLGYGGDLVLSTYTGINLMPGLEQYKKDGIVCLYGTYDQNKYVCDVNYVLEDESLEVTTTISTLKTGITYLMDSNYETVKVGTAPGYKVEWYYDPDYTRPVSSARSENYETVIQGNTLLSRLPEAILKDAPDMEYEITDRYIDVGSNIRTDCRYIVNVNLYGKVVSDDRWTITVTHVCGASAHQSDTSLAYVDYGSQSAPHKGTYTLTKTHGSKQIVTPVENGKFVNLPTAQKIGYIFSGWKTQGGNMIADGSGVTDAPLITDWEAAEYTISFVNSAGKVSFDKKQTAYLSEFGELPVADGVDGYVFWGWSAYQRNLLTGEDIAYDESTHAIRNTIVTADSILDSPKDITLYAVYKPATLNITLDANGGKYADGATVKTETRMYTGYYSPFLENPTRDGYAFAGWAKSPDGGGKIVQEYCDIASHSSKIITKEDHTLYAVWTTLPHKDVFLVDFDWDGGKVSSLTGATPSSFDKTISLNIVDEDSVVKAKGVKDGYQFMGFKTTDGTKLGEVLTNASLTSLYNEGHMTDAVTQITDKFGEYVNAYVITLKAVWKADSFVITFSAGDDATFLETSAKEVTYDEPYGELPVPEYPEGYRFTGWAFEGEDTTISSADIVKITADTKLYAKYTPKDFTVTYHLDGGTCDETAKAVVYGEPYGGLPVPKKDGYTFTGWFSASANGEEITTETVVTKARNHTIYARWKLSDFTVRLEANDGDCDVKEIVATYTQKYGMLPTPVKTGCDFKGWYTSIPNGSRVTSTVTYTATKDTTLYAYWIPKRYTVSFESEGELSSSLSYVYYGGNYNLPDTTRDGYQFTGWVTKDGDSINVESICRIASDHTIYATFKKEGEESHKDTISESGQINNTVISERMVLDTKTNTLNDGTIVTVDKDGDITLPVLTKEGYIFGGWYLDADCSESVSGGLVIENGQAVVYVKWIQKESVEVAKTEEETTGTEVSTGEAKTEDKTSPADTEETEAAAVKKPAKVKISKVTMGKKKATVSYKKVKGCKYKIHISTKKDMKNAKTYYTKGTKYTIKKLKSKKIYYIRVCAYRTVNGKQVCGKWSAVKKVTVK